MRPFFSTFGELLTNAAMASGLAAVLGQWIAPAEAQMVHGALALVGLRSAAQGSVLQVGDSVRSVSRCISWNCVGWQTLIFLAVSMLAGLYGEYTLRSRVETSLLGVAGILCFNLAQHGRGDRAFAFGQLPAIIVHDYGSVLATVAFLMAFWAFAYNVVLERVEPADEEATA